MTGIRRQDAALRHEQIWFLRTVMGLTQKQTAKRLKISVRTVKRHERLARMADRSNHAADSISQTLQRLA